MQPIGINTIFSSIHIVEMKFNSSLFFITHHSFSFVFPLSYNLFDLDKVELSQILGKKIQSDFLFAWKSGKKAKNIDREKLSELKEIGGSAIQYHIHKMNVLMMLSNLGFLLSCGWRVHWTTQYHKYVIISNVWWTFFNNNK